MLRPEEMRAVAVFGEPAEDSVVGFRVTAVVCEHCGIHVPLPEDDVTLVTLEQCALMARMLGEHHKLSDHALVRSSPSGD